MAKFDRSAPRSEPMTSTTRTNIPLLLIATAFLGVTILLVMLQPGSDSTTPTKTAIAQPVAPQPEPSAPAATERASTPLNGPLAAALRADSDAQTPVQAAAEPDVVSRAFNPLLTNIFTPIERVTSAYIIEELRQPIRLINVGVPKRDLPTLIDDVLVLLSPNATKQQPELRALLVEAISQRQSDAYIRELLSLAIERDGVTMPTTLRTTTGTLDAFSMLKAMAQTAGTPVPVFPDNVETNGTQKIVPGDSLARLALRYYGQPLKYDLILAANPQIDPMNPVLTPGDVIQMPKP